MSHARRVLLKVLLVLLSCVVALVSTLAAGNAILTAREKKTLPAPGTLVEVNGLRIHVYWEGTGERRVLLWSGLGTPCPSVDFKPLVSALRDGFTAIVVENFGYGWSDRTRTARTSENIVEETREALRRAGLLPPYVLVSHSISGVYALYYATRYPEEVDAVVGLDIDVPEIYDSIAPIRPSYGVNVLRVLGLVRLATAIRPSLSVPPTNECGCITPEDERILRAMACWNAWNPTVLGESEMEGRNNRELSGRVFPQEIPTIMLVSREIVDFVVGAEWPVDWVTLHERVMGNAEPGNVIVVEGGHYIHWSNFELIRGIIEALPPRRGRRSSDSLSLESPPDTPKKREKQD